LRDPQRRPPGAKGRAQLNKLRCFFWFVRHGDPASSRPPR
jgi:hypothetical protein